MFFWMCCVVRGILVPRPLIEPVPLALEAQSINQWTTREVLKIRLFYDPLHTV